MGTVLAGLKNLAASFTRRKTPVDRDQSAAVFREKYNRFQSLLESNTELLKICSEIEEMLRGRTVFGMAFIRSRTSRAIFHAIRMIKSYEGLSGRPQPVLLALVERLSAEIKALIETRVNPAGGRLVLDLGEITAEMVDQAGGKCANLGEIAGRVGLPVPPGFAVTTAAFQAFFEEAGLYETIASIRLGIAPDDPASMAAAAEDIQAAILRAPLPQAVAREIDAAAARLEETLGPGMRLAVRSSAIGEDGELSFAGQYLTMLNVSRDRLAASYKFVLASLFTPRAMSYRLLKGIPDDDVAMAAACLALIPSKAAGVLYTRLPEAPDRDELLINAVWGLGPYAVDGVITPDAYRLDRHSLEPTATDIADKPRMLVASPTGGLTDVPVAEELRRLPCLTPEQAHTLAGWGMALERHFGLPQDMEWALAEDGALCVLQSRQLTALTEAGAEAAPPVPGYEVALSGGQTACVGAACGPVRLVARDEDLDDFPDGGVLVAPHSSPGFMVAMKRAAAIVADHGSVTGHMASLSREFGVPTLLGLGQATTVLRDGEIVTVDASGCRIYRGRVESLLDTAAEAPAFMAGTQVHAILAEAAKRVVPLTLLNPKAPEFRPESCTSLHDVTRLLHEWSYGCMFTVSDLVAGQGGGTYILDATTGLDLHIIDLGGGIQPEAAEKTRVRPQDIASKPFAALLTGLVLSEEAKALRPVNLGGFLSVMSVQLIAQPKAGADRFGEKSYAIISDKYLNFSSRVGYHYGVLDCYCGHTVNKNYITFSFSGGAADDVKRARRATAIGRILTALGFTVEAVSDRVSGRFQKFSREVIAEQLGHMGRLLQFTRQTDMLMVSDASMDAMVACFLSGAPCFDPATFGSPPAQETP
ncbi:PEP/pyruvate-binding domain-containing protein [Solidesulfovibrio magneticus]|uniref:Phosphoenolpyruvate synthase n=1 Tax=Solidesulfovibrio magneticus (strain ATCC 700980 / DSM 13731 / RS-1) TaxID=573370 RepID=C4XL52_SOLM1|nr:PEP/pyruvate-binding domain-containing protein [Solidesulfovibrio magneticus]BAH76993.1 pyruvate phosphate dikinase, PEP/pyruvate binding domain protein [Solidesulfovibrio magneticus RS-1]